MKRTPDQRTPLLGMFRGPRRMFEKAQRDGEAYFSAQRAGDLVAAEDAFFNFVVTTHSILDWVRHTRPDLADEVRTLINQNSSLQACQVLANSAKHATIDVSRNAYQFHEDLTLEALASANWTFNITTPDGSASFDEAPPFRVKIVQKSGTRLRLTDVIQEVLTAWENFLRTHGL